MDKATEHIGKNQVEPRLVFHFILFGCHETMASRLGMVSEDTYCPEPNVSLGGNRILQILEANREQPRVVSIYGC